MAVALTADGRVELKASERAKLVNCVPAVGFCVVGEGVVAPLLAHTTHERRRGPFDRLLEGARIKCSPALSLLQTRAAAQ